MIRTYRSAKTRELFEGKRVKRWMHVEAVAMRKLAMLARAQSLKDLRIPPANRL